MVLSFPNALCSIQYVSENINSPNKSEQPDRDLIRDHGCWGGPSRYHRTTRIADSKSRGWFVGADGEASLKPNYIQQSYAVCRRIDYLRRLDLCGRNRVENTDRV